MSPWRMMNEWGVPGIELWSLLHSYCERLARKGEYVPDIILAGGFTLEDQMFKGIALAMLSTADSYPSTLNGWAERGRTSSSPQTH